MANLGIRNIKLVHSRLRWESLGVSMTVRQILKVALWFLGNNTSGEERVGAGGVEVGERKATWDVDAEWVDAVMQASDEVVAQTDK